MSRSVFISSTSQDLAEYRQAAFDVIARLDLRPIDMKYFGSAPGGASGVSLKEVGKADIFVGIIARRYGYVPDGAEKSVTEQEYDEAVRRRIPRLMYLLDPAHEWPAERVEADENAQAKLAAFRAKVEKGDVRSLFTTPENLVAQMTADLTKLLDKQRRATMLTRALVAGVIVLALIAGVLVADPGIRSDVIEMAGLASSTPTPTLTPTNTSTPTPSPTATNTPRPTATPLEGLPASEDEIVVVVAKFEQANTGVQPSVNVREVLEEASEQVGGSRVIEIGHTIDNREQAQAIADIYRATLVVYGRVEPGGVRVSYEIIPRSNQVIYEFEGDFRVSSASLENFDAFLFDGMDTRYVLGLSAGQLYIYQGDFAAALEAFELAEQAINPERASDLDANVLYFYAGVAADNLGNDDLALNYTNRALEINPDMAEALNNRGSLYYKLGDKAAALEDFSRSLALLPDAIAYSNRGVVNDDFGNYGAALSDFEQAIALDPNYAMAYVNRSATYMAQSNYLFALVNVNRALDLDPQNVMAYYNRGTIHVLQKDFENAIPDFTRALELDPTYIDAYVNRGAVYTNLGNYRLAMADFEAAIELNPNYAIIYVNRGLLYFVRKEYDAALEEMNEAIRLDPESTNAYLQRGRVYFFRGDYPLAIDDLNYVIEVEPESVDAYQFRGGAHELSGMHLEAIEDFTRAIELSPENFSLYFLRARSYYFNQEYEKAIEDYTRAITLNPEAVSSYNDRGFVYYELGNYEAALDDYNHIIEIDPEYATVYEGFGEVYYAQGRYIEALASYRRYVELAGENTKPEVIIRVRELEAMLTPTPPA